MSAKVSQIESRSKVREASGGTVRRLTLIVTRAKKAVPYTSFSHGLLCGKQFCLLIV
jgi:hypothetical protein